jgi:hypothetical protein
VLRSIGVAVLALAALAASAIAAAGNAGGTFSVRIGVNGAALGPPGAPPGSPAAPQARAPDTCISESLSARTGAVVRVVCATGQFVSIGPRHGRRFLATHGGAFGYYIRPTPGVLDPGPGASAGAGGTITSFRVYSMDEAGGPLHMLVSF